MKITQAQLYGYNQAKREFISDNDNYNKTKFGITKELYYTIHHAVIDEYGLFNNYPELKKINKRLSEIV